MSGMFDAPVTSICTILDRGVMVRFDINTFSSSYCPFRQRLNLYKTSETSDLNSILSAAYPTKENAKFWIDVRAETSFEVRT